MLGVAALLAAVRVQARSRPSAFSAALPSPAMGPALSVLKASTLTGDLSEVPPPAPDIIPPRPPDEMPVIPRPDEVPPPGPDIIPPFPPDETPPIPRPEEVPPLRQPQEIPPFPRPEEVPPTAPPRPCVPIPSPIPIDWIPLPV